MMCGAGVGCGELLLRLLVIGLSNGAVIALNAIGVTLVYGVVRTINFAHGDLFALTTALVALAVVSLGLRPELGAVPLLAGMLLTLGGALVGGALAGLAVERAAFRPFRGGSRVAPLIATIGISFMLYQGALFLRYATNAVIPGEHRSVPGVPELPRLRIPELLPDLDVASTFGLALRFAVPLKDLLLPLLALAFALAVGGFLRWTRAGRALRACAQDPQTARLCGVDPNRAIGLAFALAGGLAGAAAFVFTLYYTHPYTLYGAQSSLVAFTAAILGGVGRPGGAFISGLLLGVLAALSDYFLAVQWTPVLVLVMLMLLLVLRPTGLAGEGSGGEDAGAGGNLIAERRARSAAMLWLFAGVFAVLAAYPLLDQALGLRLLVVLTGMLVFALMALGLNMVLGFAGLLDLGYAACFAIGAYAAGFLTMPGGPGAGVFPGGLDFSIVLLVCGMLGALFGVLNAAVTLRLRGEYLAIVTLAFGQIVPQVVLNLDQWTGGARGMSALPPPRLLGHTLHLPLERYYLAVGMVLAVALASLRLKHSRLGRGWAALSMDEDAAASCGVAPGAARALVFGLGAAVAGSAGALFASSFSYVDPNQAEFRFSAMVLAMVVVGGAGSVPGVIVGALLVASYDLLAIPLLGAWAAGAAQAPGFAWLGLLDPRGINYLSFGLILYLTVLLRARRRTSD